MFDKTGLVLAGGGGKGAYQAGVWKALVELGISEQINCFSGTSIGALNATLFAASNVDTIEKVWLETDTNDVLNKPAKKILPKISAIAKGIVYKQSKSQIAGSLIKETIKNGFFSRNGLLRIIEENVDLKNFSSISRKVFAACTKIGPPQKAEYFLLNKYDPEKVKSILLASSAIPGAYKMEVIDGEKYFDGAITDNTPIKPLVDEGCRNIIVVFLNKEKSIDIKQHLDINFFFISPGVDQGRLFNFKNSEGKIKNGYRDAIEVLEGVKFNTCISSAQKSYTSI